MAHYQPRDKYFKRAREQGLPSRAAFKLSELLERHRLLHPRMRVLDLGCAPGGWLAMLARMTTGEARIVGVDLVPCPPISPKVSVLTGDVADPAVRRDALGRLGGRANLIISDMAPKLSGIKIRDEARCEELLNLALQSADEMLKPGGAMIAKAFMSGDFAQTLAAFHARFRTVDIVRTAATRPGSRELYLVARDFRPTEAA
ncbi:MAG TPA: RlmE family RNA methyltransferase [Candidatus Binataceae bacterium]|jgi:23S rRNA (uridine2552-2'-O)-methyltransferase|nr:RlmE family RNA methyltransferase [Candidatus Binataceae bacterium]